MQAKLTSGTNIYENAAEALADTGLTLEFRYKPTSLPDPDFAYAGIYCRNSGQSCKDFAIRYCCGTSFLTF